LKLSQRDRRAVVLLATAAAVMLVVRFVTVSSTPDVAEAAVDSVDMAEKKLVRFRQLAATLPAKEAALKQAHAELASREAGIIATDTAQQAQAQLLQVIRALGKTENIDARGGEFGPVRPLGEDYGEVTVSVAFECRIEQLLNFLAALTAEKSLLATSEIRIVSANPKEKTVETSGLGLSGVIPRKLVRNRKDRPCFEAKTLAAQFRADRGRGGRRVASAHGGQGDAGAGERDSVEQAEGCRARACASCPRARAGHGLGVSQRRAADALGPRTGIRK